MIWYSTRPGYLPPDGYVLCSRFLTSRRSIFFLLKTRPNQRPVGEKVNLVSDVHAKVNGFSVHSLWFANNYLGKSIFPISRLCRLEGLRNCLTLSRRFLHDCSISSVHHRMWQDITRPFPSRFDRSFYRIRTLRRFTILKKLLTFLFFKIAYVHKINIT